MKLFAHRRSVVLTTVILTAFSFSAAQADTLADQCAALGGEEEGALCIVVTEEVTPFANIIRDAGKSGLGWTSVGNVIVTTTDTYEVVISSEVTEVFVAGDPTLPGCKSSGSQPKKCADHYETQTVETEAWELLDSISDSVTVVTGCFNPGGRNMGTHKHCAI